MNTGSVIWCPLLTGEILGAWEGTAFPGSARREVSADSRLQWSHVVCFSLPECN